jgi:hypothetical protein
VAPKFSSPEEFLAYVKFARANPLAAIQSDANLEFQRIHEEKLSAAGQIDPEALASPHDYWLGSCGRTCDGCCRVSF